MQRGGAHASGGLPVPASTLLEPVAAAAPHPVKRPMSRVLGPKSSFHVACPLVKVCLGCHLLVVGSCGASPRPGPGWQAGPVRPRALARGVRWSGPWRPDLVASQGPCIDSGPDPVSKARALGSWALQGPTFVASELFLLVMAVTGVSAECTPCWSRHAFPSQPFFSGLPLLVLASRIRYQTGRPMAPETRKPRCAGSEKHITTVAKIRAARQEAKVAMNKMRAELKKDPPFSCQHMCPRVMVVQQSERNFRFL